LDRIELFKTELGYIKNQQIRKFTESILHKIPEYFFSVPASSTGKYHPAYALGEGGLVRHTKAAVRIAVEMFRIGYKFTDDEKDMIVSALILHDTNKSGAEKSEFTVHEHPVLIAEFAQKNKPADMDDEKVKIICGAIASHMGQWNTNKYSKVTLPVPSTVLQRYVHMCDYLASRKCLEFNFEVEVAR
jgi:23S rRNA maturation-related 3'-5' exoribonuclease YhaM